MNDVYLPPHMSDEEWASASKDGRLNMRAGQLLHDNWRFILSLTNDEDEAQRLALHILETIQQFKPDRAAFTTFVKLKLRELRQHYSDKGVVGHTCLSEPGHYVSMDKIQIEGEGDDEEVEASLPNLIAALPPPDLPAWLREIYYEETKSRLPAHCETLKDLGGFRTRVARIPGMAVTGNKPNWISPQARQLHPKYYTALAREFREDQKRDRRHSPPRKRQSPEMFIRELKAQSAEATVMAGRIYFGERVIGARILPKDTLWQKDVPDFLKRYWSDALNTVKCGSRRMSWRRWIGLMESDSLAWACEWRRAWIVFGGPFIYRNRDRGDVIVVDLLEPDEPGGWAFAKADPKSKVKRRAGRWPEQRYSDAYIRAYLARNGLALRSSPRSQKRRSPFLTWVRRQLTDEISATRTIKKENNDLLWCALRVLCYKRRWSNGIPSHRLFPEDKFSP